MTNFHLILKTQYIIKFNNQFIKLLYFKPFNRINTYKLKKNKSLYKKSNIDNNDFLFQDNLLEEQIKENNLFQKYNNEVSYDFDMDGKNISDIKINSKKYVGIQKKKSKPILNYIKMNDNKNIITPIENKRYIDNFNNNAQFNIKAFNSNNLSNIVKYKTKNQFNEINNNNPLLSNKTLYSNHTNNNKNSKLNYLTDYSIDDNTTSQSSQVNLYIKKINEYKKRNQELFEKLKLFSKNLKLKDNEIQNLKQKNKH